MLARSGKLDLPAVHSPVQKELNVRLSAVSNAPKILPCPAKLQLHTDVHELTSAERSSGNSDAWWIVGIRAGKVAFAADSVSRT